MYKLSFKIPILEKEQLVFQILTDTAWLQGIENATKHEVLEHINGSSLTLYLSSDGVCYGRLNSLDFDEAGPDWDEGFDDDRQLLPAASFGYAFQSIEDARSFWRHVVVTWYDESTPYGFVRLTPAERTQFVINQTATRILEQYDIEGWESVQLNDGRILLTNSHRTDKAHAHLFNSLTEYLMDKKANDDFLDYINQQKN